MGAAALSAAVIGCLPRSEPRGVMPAQHSPHCAAKVYVKRVAYTGLSFLEATLTEHDDWCSGNYYCF